MKRISIFLAIFVASIAAVSFAVVNTHAQKNGKFFRSQNAIPGQYIVVLAGKSAPSFADEGIVQSDAYQLAGAYGANVDKIYSGSLRGFSAQMSPRQAERMSSDPRVLFVEQDSFVSVDAVQSPANWGIDRIDQRLLPLSGTYEYMLDGSGVHAYILDTGIRATHADFGGRASVAVDVLTDGQNGFDCHGHGTHVAGIVGSSTYGVAKNVSIHAVRVLPCDGFGQISDIITGINWVTANRINPAVANISIGAGTVSPAFDLAIENSVASGVTYVVAAGNSNKDACLFSPADTPNAITVGAIGSTDAKASYSNFGPCVDIFAPGTAITSLSNADDTSSRVMSGTSMASPMVAGVSALYLQSHPTATPADVDRDLKAFSTKNVVSGTDSSTTNNLVYSLEEASGAPAAGTITIIKEVTTLSGGTASSTSFTYSASNLSQPAFQLIDNDAPPADRYVETASFFTQSANEVTVTEDFSAGWQLQSISCTETMSDGSTGIQNSTVDIGTKSANLVVDSGESVTCKFVSRELAPTAAPVSLSGRVVSDTGKGMRGIGVSLQNANTGATMTAISNTQGHFNFDNLPAGDFYIVWVSDTRRYSFADSVRSFSLTDNLSGIYFVATRR